jgi:predicted transcriptional regulator
MTSTGFDFNTSEQRRIAGTLLARYADRRRLRAARTTRRLTLRALGDRLGVSASLISQVERGLAKHP